LVDAHFFPGFETIPLSGVFQSCCNVFLFPSVLPLFFPRLRFCAVRHLVVAFLALELARAAEEDAIVKAQLRAADTGARRARLAAGTAAANDIEEDLLQGNKAHKGRGKGEESARVIKMRVMGG
jgi:hypothetical protein